MTSGVYIPAERGADLEARTFLIRQINAELAGRRENNGLGAMVLGDGSITASQGIVGAVSGMQVLIYPDLVTEFCAETLRDAANSAIQKARIGGIVPGDFPDAELYSPPGS